MSKLELSLTNDDFASSNNNEIARSPAILNVFSITLIHKGGWGIYAENP